MICASYYSQYEFYRYQNIRTSAAFCCPENQCQMKWRSKHTWVRFDLYYQSARIFGQTCPAVQRLGEVEKDPGQSINRQHLLTYIVPNSFTYAKWSRLCKNVLKSKYDPLRCYIRNTADYCAIFVKEH